MKLRLFGDATLEQGSWVPQVSVGVQFKRNDQPGVVKFVGAKSAEGTDFYISATRLYLAQSLLLNATVRFTKANQIGIPGFGGVKSPSRRRSPCLSVWPAHPCWPKPYRTHSPRRPISPQVIPNPAPRDPAFKPYFAEFGGKAGLVAVVDDFMGNLMADLRTHPFFAPVDHAHVKKELVDQFCVILDGPCKYTGKNMVEVHKGLDINRTNFNALVEDLQKAMDKHDVPFHAQNKLLAKLAPMHRVIVTKK